MTGFEIIGALSGIIAILATINNLNDKDNDKDKTALLALNDAITSTEKYLSISKKTNASIEANYELTNSWHIASLSFRDAGYEKMQSLCSIKGDYWLDPAAWSEEQVQEAGIKLNEMRSRLKVVLTS